MHTPWTNSVTTLEQARDFVLEVRMCGVLHDSKGALPTLWDAVDAPTNSRASVTAISSIPQEVQSL